jgi:hypothetical protein
MRSDYLPSMMNTLDALAAIRRLDALPEARRRYLAVLAADAPNDTYRARIVMMAKRENIEVRDATERAVNADSTPVLDGPRITLNAPQRPLKRPQVAGDGQKKG